MADSICVVSPPPGGASDLLAEQCLLLFPVPASETPLAKSYPWWNDTVFYEVFLRSFMDSDGDGTGDINGLTEVLDYLNDGDPSTHTDLGISGIWLMPINPSPSYHGYDVLDYYRSTRIMAPKKIFNNLVDEAHKRGIKVIIDLVINHTSSAHPWFEAAKAGDAKYRDRYVWSEPTPGFSVPGASRSGTRLETASTTPFFGARCPT